MGEKEKTEIFLNIVQSDSCVICYNSISDEEMCVTNCEHKYCFECLNTWFNRGNVSCPFCRRDILHFFKNNEKNNIVKVSVSQITNERENTINRTVIENNIITNRKLAYFKFCFFINLSYLMYLQYINFYLYKSYLTLQNNCSNYQ